MRITEDASGLPLSRFIHQRHRVWMYPRLVREAHPWWGPHYLSRSMTYGCKNQESFLTFVSNSRNLDRAS